MVMAVPPKSIILIGILYGGGVRFWNGRFAKFAGNLAETIGAPPRAADFLFLDKFLRSVPAGAGCFFRAKTGGKRGNKKYNIMMFTL